MLQVMELIANNVHVEIEMGVATKAIQGIILDKEIRLKAGGTDR